MGIPRLECSNVIWGPQYKGDQQMTGKVQKRATKLILNMRHLSYDQNILNSPSLMYRRRYAGNLQNKVNANKDHFFKFNVMQTRGHQYTLCKPMK